MKFFIIGLSRSRTSWLSNLFTYKGSYCFHELCTYGKDIYQLKEVMEQRTEDYVGTCDSALPFYFEYLAEICTQGFRIAVVRRDVDEARESFFKAFGYKHADEVEKIFAKTDAALDNIINKYEPLVVPFEELDNERVVNELWSYCIPELPFDVQRFNMLKNMRIEPYQSKYMINTNFDNAISIIRR